MNLYESIANEFKKQMDEVYSRYEVFLNQVQALMDELERYAEGTKSWSANPDDSKLLKVVVTGDDFIDREPYYNKISKDNYNLIIQASGIAIPGVYSKSGIQERHITDKEWQKTINFVNSAANKLGMTVKINGPKEIKSENHSVNSIGLEIEVTSYKK